MVKIPVRRSSPQEMKSLSGQDEYRLPDPEQGMPVSRRLLIGILCVGAGLALSAVGLGSISYRLMNVTVEGGLVNGRLLRLQAPMDGKIQDFFARPGVSVQAGQVLVRLSPLPLQTQDWEELRAELVSKTAQKAAAQQAVMLLQAHLTELMQQDRMLQTVNLKLAEESLAERRAALQGAIADEQATRTEYERYQQLQAEGGVSQQLVDQKQADWQGARAEVEQIRATLRSAETSSRALRQGAAIAQSGDLREQVRTLSRQIQQQTGQVAKLATEIQTLQQRLQNIQQSIRAQKDLEITAPFAGVIYNTERDAGEQVNRPEVLLSLLDCNNLWVETLLSVEQAQRIDDQKPVRVQLTGGSTTVVGQITLIEALSPAELAKKQAQALIPAVPAHLTGVPLSRVVIEIPPTAQQEHAHQFCGVGQSAQVTFGTRSLWGQ